MTSTDVPSDAPSTTEQEVIDRYLGYWGARLQANSGVPNPDHPGLPEFATGPQLTEVVSETRSNLEAGRSFRPSDDPVDFRRVDVVSLNGEQAILQDCWVDDAVVIDRTTGRVINDQAATYNGRADLSRIDGSWRVARVRLLQRWEGVAGCASGR